MACAEVFRLGPLEYIHTWWPYWLHRDGCDENDARLVDTTIGLKEILWQDIRQMDVFI